MGTPVGFVRSIFDVWLPALLEPWFIRGSMMHSLVFDGTIAGVGSIVMFVPVIFFMFLFLSLLEQSGYIARVARIMDRLMRLFGLQGQSVMPMIMAGGICGGCAVPAIMATRGMTDRRERILTILILPMMNCGAKMPVYLLLVGTFFAAWKSLIMAAIVFISWAIALTCAKLLSRTVVCRGCCVATSSELPPWQKPRFSKVLQTASQQSWWFLKKAGTVILAISVLLWCLMFFPQPSGDPSKSERLAHSFAGRVGRSLEPISRLAGFDWRDNVALIGGFVAKEVIVSSLGTLHSAEPDKLEESNLVPHFGPQLPQILPHLPGWNGFKAFAMILFVMIYAPCVATCAVIYQETRQWRWVFVSIGFNTAVAFLLAVLVYQSSTFFC